MANKASQLSMRVDHLPPEEEAETPDGRISLHFSKSFNVKCPRCQSDIVLNPRNPAEICSRCKANLVFRCCERGGTPEGSVLTIESNLWVQAVG